MNRPPGNNTSRKTGTETHETGRDRLAPPKQGCVQNLKTSVFGHIPNRGDIKAFLWRNV